MPPRKAAARSKSKKAKHSVAVTEPPIEEEQAIQEQSKPQDDAEQKQEQEESEVAEASPSTEVDKSPKSTIVPEIASAAVEFVEKMTDPPTEPIQPSMTMEERVNKLNALRLKMRQSAQANRADLISESQRVKTNVRDLARLEKQRKLHETLRLKVEAEDRGEDVERAKNWEYTIEENDLWEKRLKRKKTRADFEFHDDAHAARRKYKKDLDHLKPDLEAYNAQKEAAMGYKAGTLTGQTSSDAGPEMQSLQVATVSREQQLAAENLYRDANTLLYADNKPSEEAIDRVVSKLNLDLDKRGKRSRKRLHEDDGDITYINERNRVFNKKIARYYDKYTSEIRASFERGTAL